MPDPLGNWDEDPRELVIDGYRAVDTFSRETWEALDMYVNKHVRTGSFLQCVLENDLAGAMQHADFQNKTAVYYISHLIVCCAPAGCWGSPEKVKAWLSKKDP